VALDFFADRLDFWRLVIVFFRVEVFADRFIKTQSASLRFCKFRMRIASFNASRNFAGVHVSIFSRIQKQIVRGELRSCPTNVNVSSPRCCAFAKQRASSGCAIFVSLYEFRHN